MSTPRPAILILGLALALAACSPTPSVVPSTGPSGSQAGLRPVTLLLGFQPDVQFAPFYLAQQDGLFADAGLDVTIEHSDDVIRLVADGQSEFGVADATDVMIARTSGIPIKYVSTLYGHFPVALIGAPETLPAEPSGLAGLRIGTPGRFGSSWHALLALLDAGGLTEDDVTIREYPQFNQVEGLLNGDVDLITGFRANEPLRLEAQGFEVALMTVDDFAPLPGPGIVVGDELLGADPADGGGVRGCRRRSAASRSPTIRKSVWRRRSPRCLPSPTTAKRRWRCLTPRSRHGERRSPGEIDVDCLGSRATTPCSGWDSSTARCPSKRCTTTAVDGRGWRRASGRPSTPSRPGTCRPCRHPRRPAGARRPRPSAAAASWW